MRAAVVVRSAAGSSGTIDLQQARDGESAAEAEGGAEQREPQALAEHEREDVAELRAERHADADFVRALHDEAADHAIDAEGGEHDAQQRRSRRAASRRAQCWRASAAISWRTVRDVVDRLVGIDGGDGAAQLGCERFGCDSWRGARRADSRLAVCVTER